MQALKYSEIEKTYTTVQFYIGKYKKNFGPKSFIQENGLQIGESTVRNWIKAIETSGNISNTGAFKDRGIRFDADDKIHHVIMFLLHNNRQSTTTTKYCEKNGISVADLESALTALEKETKTALKFNSAEKLSQENKRASVIQLLIQSFRRSVCCATVIRDLNLLIDRHRVSERIINLELHGRTTVKSERNLDEVTYNTDLILDTAIKFLLKHKREYISLQTFATRLNYETSDLQRGMAQLNEWSIDILKSHNSCFTNESRKKIIIQFLLSTVGKPKEYGISAFLEEYDLYMFSANIYKYTNGWCTSNYTPQY